MSMQEDVDAIGEGEWDAQIVWIDPERLRPNPSNPNEQDERTFNALVASIQQEGWLEPCQVVQVDEDEHGPVYEIQSGQHRWEAAKVIGCKVMCLPLDPAKFDQDRRDWNLVKQNILRGDLNPEKFTTLYRRLTERYDDEVMQSLMGFTTEDAFRKLYKEVKSALPPELQSALDDVKDEIRTIDDLSMVLNRLFAEYGETLPSNMMVFSWGGREVLWVRCDDPLWKMVSALAKETADADGDVAARMHELLQGGLVLEAGEAVG